jgi:SpoVK/Ycf46/Vps4 family AAA+-type ATPase
MTFIAVSAAEIYSPYVGNAEKLIVKLFNQARMSSPAIIFLDEIDALVGNRTGSGSRANPVQQRILSTLLTEMDGIGIAAQSAFVTNTSLSNHILVIAATNRPDMIDSALMRPGRFDKLIYIPAPDEQSRQQILEVVSQKMPFDDDVDLAKLAEVTQRFSGADLCNLCNEAGLDAITSSFNATQITMENFKNVLDYIRPSLTRNQILWYDDYENQFNIL